MFDKAKGSSSTPAKLADSDSTEISCIGLGMTVVGDISGEGILNVLGRVASCLGLLRLENPWTPQRTRVL